MRVDVWRFFGANIYLGTEASISNAPEIPWVFCQHYQAKFTCLARIHDLEITKSTWLEAVTSYGSIRWNATVKGFFKFSWFGQVYNHSRLKNCHCSKHHHQTPGMLTGLAATTSNMMVRFARNLIFPSACVMQPVGKCLFLYRNSSSFSSTWCFNAWWEKCTWVIMLRFHTEQPGWELDGKVPTGSPSREMSRIETKGFKVNINQWWKMTVSHMSIWPNWPLVGQLKVRSEWLSNHWFNVKQLHWWKILKFDRRNDFSTSHEILNGTTSCAFVCNVLLFHYSDMCCGLDILALE